MNIYEAVNIKNANVDITTGETLSHEEVYNRIIDYLGGLSAVVPYIPFEISEIRKALKKDKHLNNLSIREWDFAAGFYAKKHNAIPTSGRLWDLYHVNGIKSASLATGVCILKHAARRIAELPDHKVKEIYKNARYVPAVYKNQQKGEKAMTFDEILNSTSARIEYLGGITALAPYIPFPIDIIKEKIANNSLDSNANYSEWREAAGFYAYGYGCDKTRPIWNLYNSKNITSITEADSVKILKEAARQIAVLPQEEIDKLYPNRDKRYYVTLAVDGRILLPVLAKDANDARRKAADAFIDANIGDLECIGYKAVCAEDINGNLTDY